MTQSRKKANDSQSVEKTSGSKTPARGWRWNWQSTIIASAVILIIALIVSIFYYQNNIAPFRRTIISVDDTTINMDYFIKRARLTGDQPITVLTSLTDELLIRLGAPQYVGEVSPEDIDQVLREAAAGNGNISESEFKEWYRQRLNDTGLSDAEYREIASSRLLAQRLHAYLAERMPTVAEQVHLHAITLETYEDAQKARARLEAGEDFADLARELSVDRDSAENGGDLGWFPRGVLPPELDYTAFSLGTDNVSLPVPFDVNQLTMNPVQPSYEPKVVYYFLMVSEEADAREVDENYLPALQNKTLQDWIIQERAFHKIHYNFNSEVNAWLAWQLSK